MSSAERPGKRGLGRGLDSLLGIVNRPAPVLPEPEHLAAPPEAVPEPGLQQLLLDSIRPNRYQPRRAFIPESLQELADSIRAQGVMQPIVVRSAGPGRYELIAGERRWRAARLAGLRVIPAWVREVDDRAALVLALVENVQREDLNPLDQALALQRLGEEFELTHQEIAEVVGKARVTVTNLLRLLELTPEVKRYLEHGELEMGHARALLSLAGPQQSALAREAVEKGWSVRQLESGVRQVQQAKARPVTVGGEREPDPDVMQLQQSLSERLGAAVRITGNSQGNGKIIISYNSLDELDGILAHLR